MGAPPVLIWAVSVVLWGSPASYTFIIKFYTVQHGEIIYVQKLSFGSDLEQGQVTHSVEFGVTTIYGIQCCCNCFLCNVSFMFSKSLSFSWVQNYHFILALVFEQFTPFLFQLGIQPHEFYLGSSINLTVEFGIEGFKCGSNLFGWFFLCQDNHTQS